MKHTPTHHRHTTHPHKGKHKKKKKEPRSIISMEMVSKTYSNDPLDFKTLILKNIYLEIKEGEFVIIFGPSGSGKSTLLNILAGLELPTAGRIFVRHRDLSKFNDEELARYHRLRMGMVFQSFNLIKSLNVALPQTANGVNYKTRRKRALHLLKILNVGHYADRHPNEISGGEQQRVSIARALINNPYFLLVDEPTGNLDSKSAEDVMNLLYELNVNDNRTIVLVTHNPEQLRYASRIVYMQDGKILIEERKERQRPASMGGADGGIMLTEKSDLSASGPTPTMPSPDTATPAPTEPTTEPAAAVTGIASYLEEKSEPQSKEASAKTSKDVSEPDTSTEAGQQLAIEKSLDLTDSVTEPSATPSDDDTTKLAPPAAPKATPLSALIHTKKDAESDSKSGKEILLTDPIEPTTPEATPSKSDAPEAKKPKKKRAASKRKKAVTKRTSHALH